MGELKKEFHLIFNLESESGRAAAEFMSSLKPRKKSCILADIINNYLKQDGDSTIEKFSLSTAYNSHGEKSENIDKVTVDSKNVINDESMMGELLNEEKNIDNALINEMDDAESNDNFLEGLNVFGG